MSVQSQEQNKIGTHLLVWSGRTDLQYRNRCAASAVSVHQFYTLSLIGGQTGQAAAP